MKIAIVFAILVLSMCLTASASSLITITAAPGGSPGCSDPGSVAFSAVVCPYGDYGWIVVTVSDPGGLPGDVIACIAAAASGSFCFCPGTNPVQGPLDPGLTVRFLFKFFGGCGRIVFTAISPDGSIAGPTPPIFVASFDENASCTVDATDLGALARDYGNPGRPCSDFNCDGRVDALDLGRFAQHYGHRCPPTQ